MAVKSTVIQMKTCQQVDDVKDTMEITTEATYEYFPLKQVITYEENTPEEGTVQTVITVDRLPQKPLVTLERKGSHTNCMTVQQGIRHQTLYAMGPCSFTMGVYGNTVACSLSEDRGSLYLSYSLDINATHASNNTLELTIRP
ncbi:MAG: DUF1934 domain-containing protein [Clostridia bacterium]|nr:DUF1934 domain-containing protein [Clostridia bacterium]